MQGAQLAELEVLYKEEQLLRKRYFNTIEGYLIVKLKCKLSVEILKIIIII